MAQLGVTNPPETMAVPVGCPVCDHTGYKGRVGIFELFRLDDPIRVMLRNGDNIEKLASAARTMGMRTMQEDALDKLNANLTSIEEVLRVISFEAPSTISCGTCNQSLLPGFRFCPYCGAAANTGKSSRRPQASRPAIEETVSR
jgi:hypothetical protein